MDYLAFVFSNNGTLSSVVSCYNVILTLFEIIAPPIYIVLLK